MTTRLVSFLGTGDYQPTVYVSSDGREGPATPYIAHALASLHKPEAIVLLATDEAWASHGEGLTSALVDDGLPTPERHALAWGQGSDDLWQHFEVLREVLDVPEETQLLLDVTHAFRPQPIFAAAALNYLRALRPRPLDCRVVYGAFEAKDAEGRSPIWDLTAAVELMDWTHGLTLFLQTGRADAVAGAVGRIGGLLGRRWFEGGRVGPRPSVAPLAKALQAFGDDLSTVRTGALVLGDGKGPGSAARLSAAIAESRGQVVAAIPPLGAVLDRIDGMVAPLSAPDLEGAEGRAALAALAGLYVSLERHLEAVTTVREARINRFGDRAAVTLGAGHDREARAAAEARWRLAEVDRARALSEVRNDLDHGGYNGQPLPAGTLRRQVVRLTEALGSGPPTRFLNLSNHPLSEWSEAQRAAALGYAEELVELGWPSVDPGLGELEGLAEETLARVPEGVTTAMVVGEYTLVALLVPALQARGIVCVASTAARQVVELGGGEKRVRFEFVRFRLYPALVVAG